MLKKLAVVGSVVAVAGLGVGGAATAWSGPTPVQAGVPSAIGAVVAAATSPTTAPSTTTTTSTPTKTHAKKHGKRASIAKRLSSVSHAQWVSKDPKTGTFVTHDAARGEITAFTTGSVTIKATDGTTETFLVTGATKVRVAGATSTISSVKVGDKVAVLGTGSGPMTATRVVARGPQTSKQKSTSTAPATTSAPPTS